MQIRNIVVILTIGDLAMTISVTAENIEYDLQWFIKHQVHVDTLLERLLYYHVSTARPDSCSFVSLAGNQDMIETVLKMAKEIGRVDGVVVVGIGGSNLAARAVETALHGLFDSQKKVPIWWTDTVDAEYLDGIISCVTDLFLQTKSVLLMIISKSGTTFETMANAEVLIALFKSHYASDYAKHLVYGSDSDSPLAQQASKIGAFFVSIPDSVGGRFSAFAMPHLLILALVGIDIQFFCQGAVAITPMLLESSLKNPALFRAVGLYASYQKNMIIHDLFMPGILWNEMGNWMRQLIGESLGKKYDTNGNIVNAGFVPTVSICSTDLHSVGQLYVEGPSKRVTTFFDIVSKSDFLCNKGFFPVSYPHLMVQSMKAVMDVYNDLKKPFFCISIPEKNAYYMGQLMQMMMVETVLLAGLMQVNPFDQPGVELFKKKLPKRL
jgi:glucose-6-phosphate isomerase